MRLQLKRYVKIASRTLTRKSPTILTGTAVIGTLGSVVLTHMATRKAMKKMEEVRTQEDYEEPETMAGKVVEEVKETWQCYAGVAVVVTVTIVAEIQSNRISVRRIATLTDAYRMSENLRKEYKEKTKELFGESKEAKIRQAMAQDNVNEDPPDKLSVIETGTGTTLCKDSFSGRYFYSDMEYIRRVRNKLDAELLANDYLRLNELYYEFPGLEPIPPGDTHGWNLDRCKRIELTGIEVIATIAPDGRPCLLMAYEVELDYDRYEPY